MKKIFTKAAKVWATNQNCGVSTLSWFLIPELLSSMKRERLLGNVMHRAEVHFHSTWPINPLWTGEKTHCIFVRTAELSLLMHLQLGNIILSCF